MSLPSSYLEELSEYLQFASVSAHSDRHETLIRCAEWVRDRFLQYGLESSLLPTDGLPVVWARSQPDPAKPTVLVYGHYDVQPEDPVELWHSPPFSPEIRQERIYARGATDNKGQHFAHMLGTRELLASPEGLPVNVVYLIEGEEEVGSSNLNSFLRKNRDLFQCDVAVVSDSAMVVSGVPTLAYALRGIAVMEVEVTGPSQDLHSGVFGGAVANPATAAARMIASLHDEEGRVAIEGFYDRVKPMHPWEMEISAQRPVGEEAILKETGAPELWGESGFDAWQRTGARPTAEINGMGGGYQGEGSKTVLPSKAFFKLSFRLVPDQSGEEILDLAERHFRKHCPPGVRISMQRIHAGEPYFVDPHTPFAMAARKAMESVFGRPPFLLREGGSIPIIHDFREELGVDCLLLALGSPDSNVHAPDENFPLSHLEKGIELHKALLRELALTRYRGDISPEAVTRNAGTA